MKKIILFLIVFTVVFYSCQQTKKEKTTVNFITSPNNPYPFSKAVQVDNLLFLAGQIGKDPETGAVVKDSIEAQTVQVFKNIEKVLLENGSDLDHVVKSTVILTDINNFGKMNAVYKTFFKDNYPARTTFAADLVGDALIEIEVVAVKK